MASSRAGRWISRSPVRRVVLLLPLVFALATIVVLSIGLLPVKSIASLRCDAVLRGGEPRPDPKVMPPIRARAEILCADATSGRKLTMVGVGIAILVVGLGAVLSPADRFERALTHAGEADEQFYEEKARQAELAAETEARQAREREAQAVAQARQEAHARASAERKEARVARARAARLRAREEAAAGPATKAGKKVAKPAKKVATKKVEAKKVATKKVAAKKVAAKPKKVVTKPARATKGAPATMVAETSAEPATPAKATKATKAAKAAKATRPTTSTKATRATKKASGPPTVEAGVGATEVGIQPAAVGPTTTRVGSRTTRVGTRTTRAGARARKTVEPVEPEPTATAEAGAPGDDSVPATQAPLPSAGAEAPVTQEVPETPVTAELPVVDASAVTEEAGGPAPPAPKRVGTRIGTTRRGSRRVTPPPPDASGAIDGAPLL